MRVLFITGEFPPMQGGVGDYTCEIAKGLAALGAQVRVLTSQSAANDSALQSLRDAPQSPISNFQLLPIISKWNWSSLRVISNYVREFAPDIVNIQYQTGAYAMHPAINFLPRYLTSLPRPPSPLSWRGSSRQERGEGAGGKGVRLVVTFHDLRIPYLFPKAGPVREWVTRELARSSDAVIATNVEDYLRLGTWNLKRLSLIPIGSNIPTIEPPNYQRSAWRAQLGVADDELLLSHFGFVNARKGCDTLIRALAELPNAKLLMIGGQTGASDPTNVAYHAQIKELIAELGLMDRVLWTGYTSPDIVTANFRAADLCVLPYREGASFQHGTLMAALAHAMPIITTAGNRQQAAGRTQLPNLQDAVNCLLVSPDDPHALAQAIQRATASPELRARISHGACELAQHFAWDKIVQQYLALLNELSNEHLPWRAVPG